MSTPAGLNRFKRTITSKFAGVCYFCQQATVAGRDYASVNNQGKWLPVCTTCAQTLAAQVAGVIASCERIADGHDVDMNDVLMPTEANLVATLQGTADSALALDTLVAMVNARVQIREQVAVATPVITVAPVGEPTNGLYLHDNGHIYKLYTTQNDRQACKLLVVIDDHGSFDYMKGGVRWVREALANGKARKLTEAEAQAFGKMHGFCVNCARDLDDDRSLAVGYGPVCAGHEGWFYPTYAEAATMLQRPVTMPNGKVIDPTWTCDECGQAITGTDSVSADHTTACSLHPDNVQG